MIKTRKIKLIPIGDEAKDRTKIYNYIRDISKELATVGNEIIRTHVINNFTVKKIMDETGCNKQTAIKSLAEKLGTSLQNSGYRITCDVPHIASDIRSNFNQTIFKTIKENFYDILNNKVSIPSFKSNNLPLMLSSRVYKDDKKYIIDFPMTKDVKEKFGHIAFELYFGKDKSNNRIIIDRTLDDTYKMCNSCIKYDGKDIYLFLTINIPDKPSEAIPNKVMGIDMGINRPVTMFITDEVRQPPHININNKIQHDRMSFIKQRKSLQESLKYSKGGHGLTRKTKALEKLRSKEKHWAQTINHTVSANVIKTALDYKVGLIKMEDLTGITDGVTDQFFKSWAYYQLQTYIKYKAESVGIKVEWVNPKNTSRECPTCHVVNSENRSKDDVTKFSCKNDACSTYMIIIDADVIAAKNIANRSSTEEKTKSKAGKFKKLEKDLVLSD